MTLTVCLQGKDGIVAATDSRGTFGDPRGVTAQNDTIRKLYLVQNVAVLQAGSQHGNMIIEEADRLARAEGLVDATDIMLKISEVARSRFDEWFKGFPLIPNPQNPAFGRPTLQLSVAGFDSADGKKLPRMYTSVSNYNFSPNLHDYGFALQGVAQYALYLLNRLYSNDLNVNALKHLAAYVITETAAQDGKVGGPVQLSIIYPDAGARLLNSNEIQAIMTENANRGQELKDIFGKC